MKTTRLLSILGIIAILVASCGPRVQTMRPNEADLSKYETFAYLPNSNDQLTNKAYSNLTVNTTVVDAINMNMKKEGYSLDRDNPDLLVLVSTKTNMETATTTDPVYATYPYSYPINSISPYYNSYYYRGYNNFTNVVGYDTDTYTYQEGTVVVDIIDRKTNENVWKGKSSKNIYNQSERAAIIGLVDNIFKEYPLNN